MLYRLLLLIVKISIRIYHRKIQVKGFEKIPLNCPLLLASNHPNAFMDAIMLISFFPRRVYALARSDVFNSPFKRKLFSYLDIMPIYRLQDGTDQLHKNSEIFEKCYSLLEKQAAILIFPEGVCIQERRLRKLRKGLARIAFGAEEVGNYNLGLNIIPVGINYTKPAHHGGDVFLQIGSPIEIWNYTEAYKQEKSKSINRLTNDLESEMAKLIVIIEDPEDDELLSNIEILAENALLESAVNELTPEKKFILSRSITKGLNELKKNPLAYAELRQKINNFFASIIREEMSLEVLNKEVLQKSKLELLYPKLLILLFTFPIFFTGLILNYIPYHLPYLLSKKIVRNNIEFFASINFSIGIVIFIGYYLILAGITAVFTHIGFVLIILIAGPFTGKYALNYRSLYLKASAINSMKNKPEFVKKLMKEKEEILEMLGSVIPLSPN